MSEVRRTTTCSFGLGEGARARRPECHVKCGVRGLVVGSYCSHTKLKVEFCTRQQCISVQIFVRAAGTSAPLVAKCEAVNTTTQLCLVRCTTTLSTEQQYAPETCGTNHRANFPLAGHTSRPPTLSSPPLPLTGVTPSPDSFTDRHTLLGGCRLPLAHASFLLGTRSIFTKQRHLADARVGRAAAVRSP